MINLTRQERLILIFLGFAALAGVSLDVAFKKLPSFKKIVYGDIASKRRFGFQVDINSAGKDELVKIRGIGSKLAQRIIDYRTLHGSFLSAEDIINVKGIGRSKFEAIKDFIKIE